MAASQSASVSKKTKSKENRSKPKKTKSLKSPTSSSFSDGSHSKKGKSKKKEPESTGGLKLLKRHAVTMSRITNRKSRKCKKVVLFNRKGTPCGKVAKQMQSYIGVLARRKVPVIRENWKAATPEEKNKIWQRVQIPFLIGPEHKKLVLESAARKWRQFKCLLTSKYVIPYLDDHEALRYPPDDYPFINADHWTEFVNMRTKPSFLEKRREQQERRSKNKYPHRMSRKGYAGLEAELADGMSDEEVDRATLWIKGRQTKDGSFKDEESKKIAEKITNLKRKVDSGELSAEGSNDVLTLALGTPEHGGRVRGVGGFVTPSTYFHLPKRRKESIEATVRLSVQKILLEEREKIVEEAREKILQEAREEIIKEAREKIVAEERAMWEAKFAEIEARINGKEAATIHPHVSGHGSCSMTADEIAQETDKAPLEEVVNNVDGTKILRVFEAMENKTIMRKRKGTKVVKEGRLDKSPGCKKGNEIPKLLEKVVVNCEEVNEAVEENVNMIDIKEPENEEGAEYVDLTMRQPTLKSNVAEVDCKLAIGSVEHIVAYATVMECEDPSQLVHGTPLGDGNVRVSIYAALEEKAKVPFPVKDEIETVKQAMGSWVAWPKHLVIKSAVKKPTKDNADKKKKRKEIGEEDSEIEFGLAKLAPSLPASLKMLCLWGEDALKDGNTISFYMEPEVFGYSRKTFILGKDVRRLASMREVTGTCIAVYQRYLYDQLKAYKMLDMVAFVDPSLIGAVGCGNGTVKAQHIKDRLVTAKPGQMFMLPYNSGDHWMLTLVDPEKGNAYFMDPLKRRLPIGDWMSIVDTAMRMYNAEKNKQSRSSVHWKNLAGIPPQPNNKECGYFIMRYMRDIIEDKDMSLFPSKWERRGSSQYTQVDIDQVRNEWGKFVVNTYVHES
ncbi:hypothetical protein ABKV19_000950 [Rosa sericea]